MAINLIFVHGRKKNAENPILDGYRFLLDKTKNDATYWKCSLFRNGSKTRITTWKTTTLYNNLFEEVDT